MSYDLLRSKIDEAVASSGGDKHDAQKLLITWAVRDPQLLLEMTKQHLKAIAAGHIDHAMRQKDAPAVGDRTDPPPQGRTAIDDLVDTAQMRVSTNKRKPSTLPPPKSTERQASAMRRIAEAFSKKKNDDQN